MTLVATGSNVKARFGAGFSVDKMFVGGSIVWTGGGPGVDNQATFQQASKFVDNRPEYQECIHTFPTLKSAKCCGFSQKNPTYQHFHTPYTSSSSFFS
jgi:hypothetical protein